MFAGEFPNRDLAVPGLVHLLVSPGEELHQLIIEVPGGQKRPRPDPCDRSRTVGSLSDETQDAASVGWLEKVLLDLEEQTITAVEHPDPRQVGIDPAVTETVCGLVSCSRHSVQVTTTARVEDVAFWHVDGKKQI